MRFGFSGRVRSSFVQAWGLRLAIAGLCIAGGPAHPAAQQNEYSLILLPGTVSDVNDAGTAVGLWTEPGGSRGYKWTQAGGAEPITTDSAIVSRFPCSAPKISSSGVITAQTSAASNCIPSSGLAGRYSDGVGLESANGGWPPGSSSPNAHPTAINSSNVVAGNLPLSGVTQPFIWAPGAAEVRVLPPFNQAFAATGLITGINDAGILVGWCSGDGFSGCPGSGHAFWWLNDQRSVLPKLPGHGNNDWSYQARAINNNNLIVGTYQGPGVLGAFLSYLNDLPVTTSDLPVPPVASFQSMDINDAGDIVTTIIPPGGGSIPYLYRDGVWIDINTLRPSGSTLQLQTVTSINNLGWMVGTGSLGQSYVLIPPPANEAPTAHAGTAPTTEDTPVSGQLSADDPNGDPLTFSIVTNGLKGTATITDAATGGFTYTPNPNATWPGRVHVQGHR